VAAASSRAAREPARLAELCAFAAATSSLSRRASTWPARNPAASSTPSQTSRPVTFDDTAALRWGNHVTARVQNGEGLGRVDRAHRGERDRDRSASEVSVPPAAASATRSATIAQEGGARKPGYICMIWCIHHRFLYRI